MWSAVDSEGPGLGPEPGPMLGLGRVGACHIADYSLTMCPLFVKYLFIFAYNFYIICLLCVICQLFNYFYAIPLFVHYLFITWQLFVHDLLAACLQFINYCTICLLFANYSWEMLITKL